MYEVCDPDFVIKSRVSAGEMQSPFKSRAVRFTADPEQEKSTEEPGGGRGCLCKKPVLRPCPQGVGADEDQGGCSRTPTAAAHNSTSTKHHLLLRASKL